MDMALLPKLVFWCLLATLAVIGFFFFARLVCPEFLSAPVDIVKGWIAAYRSWRNPEGERRRRLWNQYLEVQAYFGTMRGLNKMMTERPPDMPEAQHQAFLKLFDIKAAKELVINDTAPFFLELSDGDIGCLAEQMHRNHQGQRQPPVEALASFFREERQRIQANRHLVQEHADRLEELLGVTSDPSAPSLLPGQPERSK